MPKIVYKLLFAIIILASCSESRTLQEAEALLETNPQEADSILTSMAIPKRTKNLALYAVLKTQADYKQYKPITSDSLILTATEYYGTRHRSKHAAMAWYSQGCVYNELKNDLAAIEAYIKAEDLFPDTINRYYALTEQRLGKSYLSKGMFDESYSSFNKCRIIAETIKDSALIANCDYHMALINLQNNKYDGLNKSFLELSTNKYLSNYYRKESLVHLAKYYIFGDCHYDTALFYINRNINESKSALGATYNLLGEVYYRQNQLDSAYYYYHHSLDENSDLYTQCSSFRRLTELSLLNGNKNEASYYGNLYTHYLDTIRVMRNAYDIATISIAHKTEIEKIKRDDFRIRTIVASVLIVLFLGSLVLFIHQNHINKINSDYIKFCDNVWTQINTPLSKSSTDADYLNIGKTKYLNSPSHYILFSKPSGKTEYSRKEKEAIIHDLNVAYSDLIVNMISNFPTINNREIELCLLSSLGIDKHIICDIIDISDDNYRKLKSRLKDKLGSSYELFFYNI